MYRFIVTLVYRVFTGVIDLDRDPMTLVYELDLRILKTYLHAKMKFLSRGFQKLEHEQDCTRIGLQA